MSSTTCGMLIFYCFVLCLFPAVRSACEVWNEVFHLIDINNDGTITEAEFNSVVLNHSDLNNDGQVTKQEFTTELLRATQGVCDMNAVRLYSEQLFLLVAQPTQNSVPLARLGNLFDITDTNGDGVVVLDEYLLQMSMLALPTDRPHL
ncbi:uncharacterized protein LOC112564547 [Pomacea canaliculata]|uniref:uncharacterized protein LOC112564547 n=1 Tax=Pomacea canaliculata TaxID=400727 RepID=UPI000D72CDE9|nr:uncharacterized protein LOC112564547 [Pomacea canaliculata]